MENYLRYHIKEKNYRKKPREHIRENIGQNERKESSIRL
jgi:hypothetical protein